MTGGCDPGWKTDTPATGVPLSIDDLAFERSQLLKLDVGKHRRLLVGGKPARHQRRKPLGPDNQPIGRAQEQPARCME